MDAMIFLIAAVMISISLWPMEMSCTAADPMISPGVIETFCCDGFL